MRFVIVAMLAAASVFAQADSEKKELENRWVRVLRVTQAPHAKSPVADHPASIVAYLTDVRLKLSNGTEIARKAGDVVSLEAGKYGLENLSDQPNELIVVEFKPERIHAVPVTLDPVKLDPKYHTVPLETDRVRVLRTVLEPHIKSPMHEHPAYVVVYLTELHTTMKLADGRLVDNPRRPGEVDWRDPLKHETENIGEHTAVELQIELK